MDIKALEACLHSASKISQTVEEYEFLINLSSIVCHDFVDSQDDAPANLLSDKLLKTIDFISKAQGIVLTSTATLDWFVFYLFSRRYRSSDICNTDVASVATVNYSKPSRNVSVSDEKKYSDRLNASTESIICWLATRPLVNQNLQMYTAAIQLAQNHPTARKHLVSHALRWLVCRLKKCNLDFNSASPLVLVRGGSFDGLSEAGDLGSVSGLTNEEQSDTVSTGKWVSTVMESNGALVEHKGIQKTIDQLKSSIESLILTCTGDQLEGIRNLAFKRLKIFFEKAPLSTSAAFCLRWIELFRQTSSANWSQQESLLKLIQSFVDKLQPPIEEPNNGEKTGGQLLKQRISLVFANALNKKQNTEEGPLINDRNKSQTMHPEEENIKRILLPKIRNLTLGLLSNHRLPIRQLAVSIYTTCVSFMHPENQAKILGNAIDTLDLDISTRVDEIAKNITSGKPKLSQCLVESLTTISAKIADMPNKAYCHLDWLHVASLCETLLSHPSARVRDSAAELLVADIRRHKNSAQMARALVMVLTQAWISRQDVLFKPFNQLPKSSEFSLEQEDKTRECKMAWCSGHLAAFLKVSKVLLQEYQKNFIVPSKPKKSVFSPLFDPLAGRRFSFSSQRPSSVFRSRATEVNETAPLLMRLKQLETNELQQAIWNVRTAVSPRSSRSSGSSIIFTERSLPSDTTGIASLSSFSSTASLSTNSPSSSNCGFRTCLTVALHAAVECTCDVNASVRYLAVQTLSEVTQVIGLFDHTLLVNIIMTHMSFEPTVLTYGCLEMLLNILINLKSGKVGNNSLLLSTSKNPSQFSPRLLHGLLNVERSRVWLRSCAHYIATRETLDAVTLNATQVVMCALTSVHQLGPLSIRLSQIQMNSSMEEMWEVEERENELMEDQEDDKDCDRAFEEGSRGSYSTDSDIRLDLDIEALIGAVNSLVAVVQRLSSTSIQRNKNVESFGWIPESPTRHQKDANGTISVAPSSEISLEFTYLLLRRIEISLQAYTCCNSQRSLAELPIHLQPMNVETVAMALSSLIVPLATLAFEIFMPQMMRRRQGTINGESVTKYAETLQEKCMISILNIIGIISQCLPKSTVLGINTKDLLNNSKTSNEYSAQETANRMETQVNGTVQMEDVCEKFISILNDIFNFARRNLYPQSFLRCAHWWWMGHMCSSLPNLCQTSPGHIDTSRLVELLCNELSSLQGCQHNDSITNTSRHPKVNHGLSDRRRRCLLLPSASPPSPQRNELNWVRVCQASLPHSGSGESAPVAKSISQDVSQDSETQIDVEATDDETPTSTSLSSVSSVCENDGSKKSQRQGKQPPEVVEPSCLSRNNFPPLSLEGTTILVAKLIKCSDAKTIEPLQNIIPHQIVVCVRKMLEQECSA
ncbi:HEAT [Echinococcus multilocularis]|uniref:HEAT n=1 Tax=Echinococcus multilocularis TaxID=6211 RepID=A0A068Y1I9_ECHMU|nr:HEAT [Echinococcus multilocularis]